MINEFKIINSLNEKVELREPEADDRHNYSKLAEVYQSTGDYGSMVFQKIPLNDLVIWFSRYRVKYNLNFKTIIGQPLLEAHITLQNKMVQTLGSNKDIVFDAGEFNLTHTPYIENKAVFPKNGEYITFDIHPELSLLQRLAPDFPVLDHFLNDRLKYNDHSLSMLMQRSFIDPDMELLSRRILKHLYSPDPKKSYIEILTLELLIQFLLRGTSHSGSGKAFNKNMDALLQAHQLIQSQVNDKSSEDLYDTEIQLADKIGLTLYQFKTGFKKAFGKSPYHLMIELRMFKARQLLRDTHLSVWDIADQTGYRSHESFAKAFKGFFNIIPSEERR